MKRLWIVGIIAGAMSCGVFALKATQAAPVGGMSLAERERGVAALTDQIRDIDELIDKLRIVHTQVLMTLGRTPAEARAMQVRQQEEMELLKAKRLALWQEKDALDGADHMSVPEIRARIAAVDQNMAIERDKYARYVAGLVKGSDEAKEAEAHHREKIGIMKGRRVHLEAELADAEQFAANRNAFAAADIRAKIADVDRAMADENARYTARQAAVNQVKHDIWVAMNARPAPMGDARNALIQRMQMQDGILGEEWHQHLATMEELSARKTHLERILATIRP